MSQPHLLVAGGYRGIPLHEQYRSWVVALLHPDPLAAADICLPFEQLQTLPPETYDHIWCINYLQCHYLHQISPILNLFWQWLKPGGQLWVRVPNAQAVIEKMVHEKLEPDAIILDTPHGPLTVHDLLYGSQAQMRANRNEFYRYKHGFSERSLRQCLEEQGFLMKEVSGLPAFQLQAQAVKPGSLFKIT